MPENEKPELADEVAESEEIEVVAHSVDEEEDAAAQGCVFNGSYAL